MFLFQLLKFYVLKREIFLRIDKKIFLLEKFLVQSFCLHFLMDFFTMNINESNRLEQKLKALATTKKGDKKPRSQR